MLQEPNESVEAELEYLEAFRAWQVAPPAEAMTARRRLQAALLRRERAQRGAGQKWLRGPAGSRAATE